MLNTASCADYPQQTYNNSEEALPTANENIDPVPVVHVMEHPRMNVSRAISEEDLIVGMRTRLKAIFA